MSGGAKGTIGGKVTHGHAKGGRTREYQCWCSMRLRVKQKPHYIRNGITVCARWRSFEAFLADVGRAPSRKHTIDRWPDPTGNYKPGNVRWATMLQQRHNRRPDAKVGRPWLGKRRQLPKGKDGKFLPKRRKSDYQALN